MGSFFYVKFVSIYKIKCRETGRVYIGRSAKPELRWQHHINDLRAHRHNTKLMQIDFDLYGEDSFTFEVLCDTEYKDRKIEKEYMIKHSSQNPNFGYNYKDLYFTSHIPKENLIRDISCFYGFDANLL